MYKYGGSHAPKERRGYGYNWLQQRSYPALTTVEDGITVLLIKFVSFALLVTQTWPQNTNHHQNSCCSIHASLWLQLKLNEFKTSKFPRKPALLPQLVQSQFIIN